MAKRCRRRVMLTTDPTGEAGASPEVLAVGVKAQGAYEPSDITTCSAPVTDLTVAPRNIIFGPSLFWRGKDTVSLIKLH